MTVDGDTVMRLGSAYGATFEVRGATSTAHEHFRELIGSIQYRCKTDDR